jgi:hypothetical protein
MGLSGIPEIQPSLTHGANSARPILYQSQPWYDAYMAALFEPDRIGERINYTEQLILSRQRELFTSRVDSIEQRALNKALRALRALKMCVK